jgi:EpsI family protein
MHFHQSLPTPLVNPLATFPAGFGQWQAVHQQYFSQELLDVLRPTDYLSRRYQEPSGKSVDLYIGYHDGGQGSGPIHSPKNCLPGNGWLEIFSKPLVFEQDGKRIQLTQAMYTQGDRRELFVYWFIVQGQTLSNEFSLKLAEIVNSVRNGKRGASFVRLSLASEDDPGKALTTLESFLRLAYPAICAATTP